MRFKKSKPAPGSWLSRPSRLRHPALENVSLGTFSILETCFGRYTLLPVASDAANPENCGGGPFLLKISPMPPENTGEK